MPHSLHFSTLIGGPDVYCQVENIPLAKFASLGVVLGAVMACKHHTILVYAEPSTTS